MEPKQPAPRQPMTNETQEEYRKNVKIAGRLQKIGRIIDRELEKATGERINFVLLANYAGRSQYVSNGERDNMRELMQELLDRWDTNPDLGVPQPQLGDIQ